MTDRIVIDLDRDGQTKGLQLNMAQLDDKDAGWGYRLHGPKYNGSSKNLLRHELDARDAAEIRKMLDAVFPLPKQPTRAEVLREAAVVAGEFTGQFADMDAMKAEGLIGPFTMSAAIRDELNRMADADSKES